MMKKAIIIVIPILLVIGFIYYKRQKAPLLKILNNNNKRVVFSINGKTYTFDPAKQNGLSIPIGFGWKVEVEKVSLAVVKVELIKGNGEVENSHNVEIR